MTQATRIRELIQSAGSQFVSVHFIKADGELRQLTVNGETFEFNLETY